MMAKCKICGVSVQAGPAMHGHCLEELVEKAAEEFCDDYCMYPRGSSAQRLEEACESCPMERLLKLIKP